MVSKLLTGFDAPSCSYIYLDNELHDHNLFQAICRTNRLDGDDKDYGRIVDFKALFNDVQDAIAVYSSDELDLDQGSGGSNNVELKDWLKEGRKQLEAAREGLRYLCEPVPLPREMEQFLHYFCGDAASPQALTDTESLRISFYKSVATFVRAYAAIAQELSAAGYSDAEAAVRQQEVPFDRLRSESLGRFLIQAWEESAAELVLRSQIRPALHNTDGDKLLLTCDHFAFDPTKQSQIDRCLRAIPNLDPPDTQDQPLTFLRPSKPKHSNVDTTVAGTAMLGRGKLMLETNSIERADALRKLVEGSCQGLLQHRLRELTDPSGPVSDGELGTARLVPQFRRTTLSLLVCGRDAAVRARRLPNWPKMHATHPNDSIRQTRHRMRCVMSTVAGTYLARRGHSRLASDLSSLPHDKDETITQRLALLW